MDKAIKLFEETFSWLKANYWSFRFFTERDIVWTVQKNLIERIEKENLPYKIFTDFPIMKGKKGVNLCADIVIQQSNAIKSIKLALEFKYEPAHTRSYNPNKLKQNTYKTDKIRWTKLNPSVVFWEEGVLKDIERINQFVQEEYCVESAWSILIDEGGFFKKRPIPEYAVWQDWGNNVGVLLRKAEKVKK